MLTIAEDTFTLHLLLHLRSHYMGMDNSGPDGNRRCDLFVTSSAIYRCFYCYRRPSSSGRQSLRRARR
jgi:hypothetical protein